MGPYYDHISMIAWRLETRALLPNGAPGPGMDRYRQSSGDARVSGRTWRKRLEWLSRAWLKPRSAEFPEPATPYFPNWQPGQPVRQG